MGTGEVMGQAIEVLALPVLIIIALIYSAKHDVNDGNEGS